MPACVCAWCEYAADLDDLDGRCPVCVAAGCRPFLGEVHCESLPPSLSVFHLQTEVDRPAVALTASQPRCYNDPNNCIANDYEQNEYLPERGHREPGGVEAGAGAGREWIWESRTKRATAPVDCAGPPRR